MDKFFNGHHMEEMNTTMESWVKKDLKVQIPQHT